MNIAGMITVLLIVILILTIIFKDKIILPVLIIAIILGTILYFAMVYGLITFVISGYRSNCEWKWMLGIISLMALAIPYVHVIKTFLNLD